MYINKNKLYIICSMILFLLTSVLVFTKLFQFEFYVSFSFSLLYEDIPDTFHIAAVLLSIYSLVEALVCYNGKEQRTFYSLGASGLIQAVILVVIRSLIDDDVVPDFSLLGILYLLFAIAAAVLCFITGYTMKYVHFESRYDLDETPPHDSIRSLLNENNSPLHPIMVNEHEIVCPSCNTTQARTRTSCIFCGQPFSLKTENDSSCCGQESSDTDLLPGKPLNKLEAKDHAPGKDDVLPAKTIIPVLQSEEIHTQKHEILKKYCPFCGRELPYDARFCSKCGKAQPDLSIIS